MEKKAAAPAKKRDYDFSNETLVFETRACGAGRARLCGGLWAVGRVRGRIGSDGRRAAVDRLGELKAGGWRRTSKPTHAHRHRPVSPPPRAAAAPHRGDLAVNVALGITLLWLPLSIAAVGRGLFVKYRFTDRRISCITTAPWQSEPAAGRVGGEGREGGERGGRQGGRVQALPRPVALPRPAAQTQQSSLPTRVSPTAAACCTPALSPRPQTSSWTPRTRRWRRWCPSGAAWAPGATWWSRCATAPRSRCAACRGEGGGRGVGAGGLLLVDRGLLVPASGAACSGAHASSLPFPPFRPTSPSRPPPRAYLSNPRSFKEMEAYILQRRDELTGKAGGGGGKGGKAAGSSGADAPAAAAAPKGFSS